MKTGAKGARRERQARKILEAAGYWVIRAGGSKGVWDLVALGPRGARLIQIKANCKPGVAEREQMQLFPCYSYTSKEVWIFYDREKAPHIEYL